MPICSETGEVFEVSEDDLAFYERISPVINGKRFLVPTPQLCPKARLFRRLTYRNQIYVFKRKSSSTGKEVFSMYPEGTPFPVIDRDEWWSDQWDPLDYGQEFDFSRPFFPQFFELRDKVPHASLCTVDASDNSAYVNHAGWIRNCYFIFNCGNSQDLMYIETGDRLSDCVDCTRVNHCELCYDCVECLRCYNLQSSTGCEDCRDSYFLYECRSCEYCFGCSSLRRAKYCIYNRQASRQEYEAFISSINLSLWSVRQQCAQKAYEFYLTQPHPHIIGNHIENVSGNYLFECRNVFESYGIQKGEDLRHCFNLHSGTKDCYDFSIWGTNTELSYECVCSGGDAFNIRFCVECWLGVSDLDYCAFCSGCSHCFGCVGLRKKQFCIFNRQYDQETYYALVARIIEHMQHTREWGEFFPAQYSHVPFNLTLAHRYFPMTCQQAKEKKLPWYERPELVRPKAVRAESLPDGLPESQAALEVVGLGGTKPFLISASEIRKLRAFNAPLPRFSYDLRMQERQNRVAGIFLYQRNCAKTGKPIVCSYNSDNTQIIWEKEEFDREYNS